VLSSITNAHTPQFGILAADEVAAEKLAQAAFSQDARHINLSFLLADDTGLSLTRATADAQRYRVFTESIEGLPYVGIDGTSWEE
jgi:hypothetical protein